MTRLLHTVLREDRRRWAVLVLVCFGQLMIVLDTTIVNVALPAIQSDLGFSQASLTWVVNAYLITFGSFLLLAGRMSDLIGSRRVFMWGLALFTVSSAACGLADGAGVLIAGRFVQGFAGALAAAVALAIVVTEFPELGERRRAMSVYTFVSTAGGAIGLLAGGVLTQWLDWHWIFFINVPLGVATLAASWALIERRPAAAAGVPMDVTGAILITVAVMIGVYAIVGAADHGWASARTLGFAALAVALTAAFAVAEARSPHPLVPPAVLRLRSLVLSCAVRGTMVVSMFATFFLGSLYMERVRGLDAIQIGLAFLPMPLIVVILSLGLTARIVRRLGSLRSMVGGLSLIATAMIVLTTVDAHTAYFPTLAVAFSLVGLGVGMAFMPLLEVSMADVPSDDVGLASGLVQVSLQIIGALGLAVLSTVATGRTNALLGDGVARAAASAQGFTLACTVAAIVAIAGIVLALTTLRGAAAGTEMIAALERDGESQAIAV